MPDTQRTSRALADYIRRQAEQDLHNEAATATLARDYLAALDVLAELLRGSQRHEARMDAWKAAAAFLASTEGEQL